MADHSIPRLRARKDVHVNPDFCNKNSTLYCRLTQVQPADQGLAISCSTDAVGTQRHPPGILVNPHIKQLEVDGNTTFRLQTQLLPQFDFKARKNPTDAQACAHQQSRVFRREKSIVAYGF